MRVLALQHPARGVTMRATALMPDPTRGSVMAAPDVRSLPRNDQGLIAAGVLAFIASFFPYYGYSVSGRSGDLLGFNASHSWTAWHSYATLALLLVIAATVIAAAQVFSGESLPQIGVSWNIVVLGVSALGTLLFIIRSFTFDSGDIGPVSYGLKWGAYVVMILCIAQAVFAYLRVRAAGEAMPWQQSGAAPHPPTA
jgi:hypothetical protein